MNIEQMKIADYAVTSIKSNIQEKAGAGGGNDVLAGPKLPIGQKVKETPEPFYSAEDKITALTKMYTVDTVTANNRLDGITGNFKLSGTEEPINENYRASKISDYKNNQILYTSSEMKFQMRAKA